MTTELAIIDTDIAVYASPATNPARIYVASLAHGSRRTMSDALDTIASIAAPSANADTLPWHRLRNAETMAIRAALAERFSAATANKHLSALRGTLKAAWRIGLMTADEYMRASDVANVIGDAGDAAAGRAITYGEIMALIASCNDGTVAGARDAAIFAVAYAAGLRRAEIASMSLASYDRNAGTLTIHGKRNKVRTVPLENGQRAALEDWLDVRGTDAGALFRSIRRGDHIESKGMTPQGVYGVMERRRIMAGVSPFSPHDMRRTFVGDLLDAGADIATVSKMAGHSNIATTARYDRRGERAKRDAARKLHFPYQRAK